MATMANFARFTCHICPNGSHHHANGLQWHADGHEYVQTERRGSPMSRGIDPTCEKANWSKTFAPRSIHGIGWNGVIERHRRADGSEFDETERD